MTTLKNQFGLKYNVDVFSTLSAATSYASKCVKLHVVVLGDNCKFWVVCLADAQRLVKAGYEAI